MFSAPWWRGSPTTGLSGAVDIGGPNVLPYAKLLAECSRAAGLLRVRVPTVPVPSPLVGLGAAALSAAPFWTVTALIASLRHDMVCRTGHTWSPRDGMDLMGVREAMDRAYGPVGSSPEAGLPSDPTGRGCARRCSTSCTPRRPMRAGASLALRRLRALREPVP